MPLTPLDIHNKEFKRSFRGYDEEEVDEFLDQIIESYEALYKENLSLKETLAAKDSNINHYRDLEDTLKQTLVVAQQTADEIRHNSEKQAELLVKEAELKAAQILGDAGEKARSIKGEAEEKIQNATKDTEELRKHLQVFRVKFKTFLESQLNLLQEKDEVFNEINKIRLYNQPDSANDTLNISDNLNIVENKAALPQGDEFIQAEWEAAATVIHTDEDESSVNGSKQLINKGVIL